MSGSLEGAGERRPDGEARLARDIAACADDPLAFVQTVFPWGKAPLAGEAGPDTWQRELLGELGERLRTGEHPVRMAVASGHGVGKTALSAWLILWFVSTREHPQVVVTANPFPSGVQVRSLPPAPAARPMPMPSGRKTMAEAAIKKDYKNNWVEKDPNFGMEFVPSPKRVRVVFGGETIADSTRVMLLREPRHVPVYYFPREDVRMDLLSPTDHHSHCPWKGHCSYFTIAAGGKEAENAAWTYAEPYPQVTYFRDHIAFYWDRMDKWLEEDEEVFVHARDPFKRVDTCLSHREVRVELAGETLAKTTDARFVFETGHQRRFYIPESDVRKDLLEPSPTRTSCPYKGDAVYFHARIGGELFEDVAWSYPEPIPECPKIKGLICFFNERVDDIFIDGEAVEKVKTKWSRD